MPRLPRPLLPAIGMAMLLTTIAQAAGRDDGKAAFALREDTMKRMGRALYGTIGRVARGKAEPGPDTITAAQTVTSLAGILANLFPPGSDAGESRIKPEIFDVLVQGVQAAAERHALSTLCEQYGTSSTWRSAPSTSLGSGCYGFVSTAFFCWHHPSDQHLGLG